MSCPDGSSVSWLRDICLCWSRYGLYGLLKSANLFNVSHSNGRIDLWKTLFFDIQPSLENPRLLCRGVHALS